MKTKPNVILIYADDLGRGMLSCYGQKHFRTPNIDGLCDDGMKFNFAYGCHMCAPARASLICGAHDCHAGRWTFTKADAYIDYAKGLVPLETIYELIHNTGIDQRSEDIYLPMIFTKAGYTTGQIGKLEWGFSTTGDEIKAHGWDYHYGYYDHGMCHGYYPPFMFENGERKNIEGNTDPYCGKGYYSYNHPQYAAYHNDRSDKKVYSQDIYDEKIVEFIVKNKDRPFFLYHPTQLPHLNLAIPEIDARVEGHPDLNTSEQEYASMVLRLDQTVGLVRKTLERLGLLENTMIVFTADNGHCFYYGEERNGCSNYHDAAGRYIDDYDVRYTTESVGDIFDGNNGFTGCKLSSHEGGVRVPLIVSWPGHVVPGSVTDVMVSNYDFMATMAEITDVSQGLYKDGKSYLPVLDGREKCAIHDYLVYAGEHGPALLTKEGWKVRCYIREGKYQYGVFGGLWQDTGDNVIFELFNIFDDPREAHNLADERPELLQQLFTLLIKECDGNVANGTTQPHFAFLADKFSIRFTIHRNTR